MRDGGRYRWIGEDSTTNDRYRYVGETESSLKPRYIGIQVTLYGRGEPVAMNRTSSAGNGRGGTTYLGKDILGSVRSVTNEAGQLEDRYEYDAFGKPYKGDLDNGMNLGYMGKPYDSNTGLYNYGYRDYKPEAARFTTVDPIRDGSNWFVYVNSDPINYTDLWGLECSASDKVAALGNGTPSVIDDGLKDVLENRGWTYVGDNPDLRNDIHNDLKEKALDPQTSPYWDISVTDETTRYLQETLMGETSRGEPIIAGEYVNAEGDLYTVSPTSPESERPGPVTNTYLDANGDTHIDFQR